MSALCERSGCGAETDEGSPNIDGGGEDNRRSGCGEKSADGAGERRWKEGEGKGDMSISSEKSGGGVGSSELSLESIDDDSSKSGGGGGSTSIDSGDGLSKSSCAALTRHASGLGLSNSSCAVRFLVAWPLAASLTLDTIDEDEG